MRGKNERRIHPLNMKEQIMKKILLPFILILLAGCDYDVPLSQTAFAPANPALAGTWIEPSGETSPVLMEVQTDGTEYRVAYTSDGDILNFKGFQVSANGMDLIQLELQNAQTNKYLFVKYELTPEGLIFYRLNPEVVSAKCQNSEELLNSIAVHRNNPLLFTEPERFIRSVAE
jgi:hypothetical protein